ncbi:hypothetical protein, partial [Xanthovirga aplysinae]|uniref:hypothetical protein n=1 Tax=Xanthovirga aplysinae TaxID=2529853 RepID=UPI001CA3B35E
ESKPRKIIMNNTNRLAQSRLKFGIEIEESDHKFILPSVKYEAYREGSTLLHFSLFFSYLGKSLVLSLYR